MAPKTKSPENDAVGARWLPLAGMAVTAVGAVWAIASFFIVKPEAARPVPASAPALPATSTVTVSGSGNVAAGTISGGTFNVGVPPSPASGAARAGAVAGGVSARP